MAKVFVTRLDSYLGKTLGKLFTETAVGAFRDIIADEEGDGVEEDLGNKPKYEVVGTIADSEAEAPSWASEVLMPGTTKDELMTAFSSCDIIIYDVSDSPDLVDEMSWAVQTLHDHLSTFMAQKVFICVSTILTWAKTKPLNPDEPDVPFTEEDYRRRRPHPNFKDHINAEKLVIKLGKTEKSKFTTYVLACGLQYGEEENIFHFLFKEAWLGNISALPVFGDGQNMVPTIHVADLASVIVNVADIKPKTKYIVVVDDSQSTLEEIVKSVSNNLGSGRVQRISKEDALLSQDLTQCHFDQLLVDLQVEATCIKEAMKIDWKAETGLIENIEAIVQEFKDSRKLLPIRLCILGPPAVGKTTVTEQLCRHYKLHHIKIADIVQETLARLERTVARVDAEDQDEEDDGSAQQAKEYLAVLKDDKEENGGRYSNQHIIEFYKQKLKSMPCQNQGFILDGFPKTEDDAKELFAADDEAEEDNQMSFNKLFMPELVVSLDASNEFLKDRVIHLPQSKVAGTHHTEEGMLRRLKVFRERNEEDVTVLNYFDELEIHPEHFNIEEDKSPNMEETVEKIKQKVGEPRNYGPTPEEKALMKEKAEAERLKKEREEREESERQEAMEQELRTHRMKEWQERLEKVQKEEREMLETASIPLRNYLMQHVMPTLTKGLTEVCKVKPDDPVDYLAEFLFKNNPQID